MTIYTLEVNAQEYQRILFFIKLLISFDIEIHSGGSMSQGLISVSYMMPHGVVSCIMEDHADVFPHEATNLAEKNYCFHKLYISSRIFFWCGMDKKMKISTVFTVTIAWRLPCLRR